MNYKIKKTLKKFISGYRSGWEEDGYDLGWFLESKDLVWLDTKLEPIIRKALRALIKDMQKCANEDDFLDSLFPRSPNQKD
jgi:hypothetical protein